ncbi:MAG: MlaD family protein [Candidatus Omnitrophica bacterium]|jgi:paraquat-inducible protein B|nr:MlaD family protein [Candidatus Omnitrophota bacterium]
MRKANKTVIGLFVVGAVGLLIAGITVFGSGSFFKRSDKYVLFFDGSIKGLSEGAPVIFRGVKIGNIKDISLVYDATTNKVIIPVIIDIELARVKGMKDAIGYPNYKKWIQEGLRAKLEIQNFITGQLMISFNFYHDKPAKLYGTIKEYPELPTLPISPDIFELMDEIPVKEIASDLEQTVSGLNRLVNSEGISQLDETLQEVTLAARSLHLFIEYLEQHPEALIKGKPISKGGSK